MGPFDDFIVNTYGFSIKELKKKKLSAVRYCSLV